MITNEKSITTSWSNQIRWLIVSKLIRRQIKRNYWNIRKIVGQKNYSKVNPGVCISPNQSLKVAAKLYPNRKITLRRITRLYYHNFVVLYSHSIIHQCNIGNVQICKSRLMVHPFITARLSARGEWEAINMTNSLWCSMGND